MAEKKKNDASSKAKTLATVSGDVVRELGVSIEEFTRDGVHSGMAVVARDEAGEYVTSTYFVGANLADPFKMYKRIKPPAAPVVTEAKAETVGVSGV